MNSVLLKIENSIQKGGENSPFLFLSQNLEILHHELESYLSDVLQKHNVDAQSLFHISDNGENLKIWEVKNFISRGDVKARFWFQIFFIENLSRMTLQSQNACLKFFEEPGEGNIIILTDTSRAWILETILSRVQIIEDNKHIGEEKNDFYFSMIGSYVQKGSDELIRYFFSGKYEKQEYVEFLKTLLMYISENTHYTHLLDELEEDIGGILKNNLQGKYIVDKYITLLSS